MVWNKSIMLQFKQKMILHYFSLKINEDDFLQSHDQYVMMYNRIPKTGSSSMLLMLRALEVSTIPTKSCVLITLHCHIHGTTLSHQKRNNFYAHDPAHGLFKQDIVSNPRHLNVNQQMEYAKRLLDRRKEYLPKSIICNNHVHFIGD